MSWFRNLFKEKQQPEPAPLQPTLPPTHERSEAREKRLEQAYGGILDTLYDKSTILNFSSYTLSGLEPPWPEFPRYHETLKIVPPPNVTPDVMTRFWNNVRKGKEPMAFEVVSTPETMFFQLTASSGSIQLVENQLSLHFPDTVVIPQEEPASPVKPKHSLCFFHKEPTHFFDTKDTAQDPYAQLFAILDNNHYQEDVYVQFIFSPVPDDDILHLVNLLSKDHPIPKERFRNVARPYWYDCLTNIEANFGGISREKALELANDLLQLNHENDRLFTQFLFDVVEKYDRAVPLAREQAPRLRNKLPAWLACVNMFSSESSTLVTLERNFLDQYETPYQSWDYEAYIDKFGPQDFYIEKWNLINTNELTSLAHFPAGAATSERLETTSKKQAMPPDSYIID